MPFDAPPSECLRGHKNPKRGSSGNCLACERERIAALRGKEKRIAAIVARNTKPEPKSGLELADERQARKDARDAARREARTK